MSRGPRVYVYPTEEQKERWEGRADDLDMSTSEFIKSMVEAGIKVDEGFELTTERDETNQELREQRNDLKDELAHARQRIEDLENRLHRSERQAVLEYIEENPGATYAEIVEEIAESAGPRVTEHLEALEGDAIEFGDERYYPAGFEEIEP